MADDEIDLAGGDEVLGESFREPERDLSRSGCGGAVGEFEEEHLDNATDELGGFDPAGDFDLVSPAVRIKSDGNDGRFVRGHVGIDQDVDRIKPEVAQAQFAQEHGLDPLTGDDQGMRRELNVRAVGGAHQGFREVGWDTDNELAGRAADGAELGVIPKIAGQDLGQDEECDEPGYPGRDSHVAGVLAGAVFFSVEEAELAADVVVAGFSVAAVDSFLAAWR